MSARWLLSAALFAGSTAFAADWPHFHGPNRDGVATGFTPPAAWPKELKKAWAVPVGQGVATPALAGGKLYVFGFEDGKEVLRCLDAATGKEVWQQSYGTTPASGGARDFPGARSSPAVADGKVVTFGVQGILTCFDAATGKVLWQKEKTRVPMFQASCSPLVADGLVVVQTGGDGGGAVVAFDLASGAERWKWESDGTRYASPNLIDVGGLKAVLAETGSTVSAVGLKDGKRLWQTPLSTKYNSSTPVAVGPVVLYGGQGVANTAVKFERKGDQLEATKLWANDESPVMHNTPAVRGGLVYGLSQAGEVFCLDAATGKTQWAGRPSAASAAPPAGGGKFKGKGGGGGGYGSVVPAGPVLFALTPAGQLTVLDAGRTEFKELAKYQVAAGFTYAYPVVDGKAIYVRDRENLTMWLVE